MVIITDQVVFKLDYNELLERDKGWYEHKINLNQEQLIPELKVEVFIEESLPLTEVVVPALRQSNDIGGQSLGENTPGVIQLGEGTDYDKGTAHILYMPSMQEQEEAGLEQVTGTVQCSVH